jgi:cytochrome c biogenesis protein CcdA
VLEGLPVVLAFSAGLIATVNPCGFAMLPAYLSFFVGLGDEAPATRGVALAQALRVGTTVALGFLVVFGAAWLALALGTRAVIDVVPWAALVVGVAVAALGGWLLAGRQLPVHLPTPGRAAEGRSTGAVLTFGVGYAVASLSCTLPVFLTLVLGTATQQSVGSALTLFGVYAVGMALPLLAVTVGLAVGRHSLVRNVRRLLPYVNRVAGGLLLAAGVYIAAFWTSELAGVTVGPLDGLIGAVEGLSGQLSDALSEYPAVVGGVSAAVVAVAALATWWAHRRGRGEPVGEATVPTAPPARHSAKGP